MENDLWIALTGGKVRGVCEDLRYLRSSGQYLELLSRNLQRVICRHCLLLERGMTF